MSEQIPELKIDKTDWGEGPWQTESDREQWTHAGYACLILRHPHYGFWCGYVGIDAQHPYYSKHPLKTDLDVTAHSGLNYAAKCSERICHVPEPGMPDDVWWIGFDMGHTWDLAPGMVAIERAMGLKCGREDRPNLFETCRTIGYAKSETESLAEHLRERAG